METLIIYDNNGTIFYQASGGVQTPVGLQHLKVVVPTGQMVQRIDTTSEPHMPVFVEIPRPQIEVEVETLKADNEQLKTLLADLTEVVLMGV